MPLKILLCSLALAQLGVAQPSALRPRVLLPGELVGSDFWLSAPIIAIAKVTKIAFAGPPISIDPTAELSVRLTRVDTEMEAIIQGAAEPGIATFYYFSNILSARGYHTIRYWLNPGERHVVFLRRENGVLRTLADVSPVDIPVTSGRHAPRDLLPADPDKRDPGALIARAALSPAQDYRSNFAASISNAAGKVAPFVTPRMLADLLRRLLLHKDEAIRSAACMTITWTFQYRDQCQVIPGPDVPAFYYMLVKSDEGRSESIVEALRKDPSSLSVSDSIRNLADELELFTFDVDPAIRRQACETLSRLFSDRSFERCPSNH